MLVKNAERQLEEGREAYAARRWGDAYDSLSAADRVEQLGPADLELLSTSAYMLGRDDDLVGLERAHEQYLEAGERLPAARCAIWVGLHLVTRGELGPGTGWLGRAQRLIEHEGRDCAEHGYLLFPSMFQCEAAGDYEAAVVIAGEAASIGERFGDADLFALAAQAQGILLVKQGRVGAGLRTAGRGHGGRDRGGAVADRQRARLLRRDRRLSGRVRTAARSGMDAALARWCDEQPDMVSFTGTCLVHRAEILELHGDWRDALDEARRAREHCARAKNLRAAAEALYRQGELHRLRREFGAAEAAYREASGGGFEPQPGLALLRLAQGKERRSGRSDQASSDRDHGATAPRAAAYLPASRSCSRWTMRTALAMHAAS